MSADQDRTRAASGAHAGVPHGHGTALPHGHALHDAPSSLHGSVYVSSNRDDEANVDSSAAAAAAAANGASSGASRVRAASQAHAAVSYVQEQVRHMHDKTSHIVYAAFRAAVSPLSLAVCSVPAVLGLFMFSAVGFGEDTIRFLNGRIDLAPMLTVAAAGAGLVLYLTDVTYWSSGVAKYTARRLLILLLAAAVLFRAREYPSVPLAVYMLFVPTYFALVRKMLWPTAKPTQFLSACSGYLLLNAIGLFAAFAVWVFAEGNSWDGALRQRLETGMECVHSVATASSGTTATGSSGCLAAYLLWIAPFIIALVCFVFSLFTFFLARSVHNDAAMHGEQHGDDDAQAREEAAMSTCSTASDGYLASDAAISADADLGGKQSESGSGSGATRVHRTASAIKHHSRVVMHIALRAMSFLMVLFVGSLWVASSVAGAGMRLSNAVTMFIGVFFVLSTGVVIGHLGTHKLREEMMRVPMLKKLSGWLRSNWMRGAAVLMASPLFLFFVALSCVNQMIRRFLCCGVASAEQPEGESGCTTLRYSAADASAWVTPPCRRLIANLREWNWSGVLECSMYLGLGFLMFNVGVGKLVTVFLSFLNQELAALGLGTVTVIFFMIGLFMFLLPPVPGVPVYLAGGVILVAKGRAEMGFFIACVYAILVCFAIKLCAIVLQQKGIGERLKDRVSIRKAVGVNSTTIRAIRMILQEPGLDKRKVFILCGGPDWPVSVLTGILGLDVMQMLLGSVPVVFLIAPCVCAGAFLLRVPESGTWQSLASLALAGAGATQIFAMLAAGYYIEQVATKRREQLMKLEDDLEVKVAEQQAAQKKVYRAMLANWHRPGFPLTIRLILVLGAVSTMAACYIVQFAADQAFLPFEVTSSIDAPVPEGLGGSVSNLIVEPLGTHAVQALAVGCVCLILYSRWLSSPCIRAQCCCVEPDVESDQQTLASSIASDALKDTPGDTADAEAGAALDTKKLTESSRNQEFAL